MGTIKGIRRAAVDIFKIFTDFELRGLMLFGVVIIGIGVIFYMIEEKWDAAQSLYFCVATLTTVGYGDLHPTTDVSRLFTTGYILVGVGFILSFMNVAARQAARTLAPHLNQRWRDDD